MIVNNLYTDIPEQLPDELFQTLWRNQNLRVERIVSKGHCSEPGQWYNQDWDEWVVLLRGGAKLEFADGQWLELQPGDYLLLEARQKHRVVCTDPDTETIWLAIHSPVAS